MELKVKNPPNPNSLVQVRLDDIYNIVPQIWLASCILETSADARRCILQYTLPQNYTFLFQSDKREGVKNLLKMRRGDSFFAIRQGGNTVFFLKKFWKVVMIANADGLADFGNAHVGGKQ